MALADTARLIASLELQDKFSKAANDYDKAISGMERKTSTLGRIGSEASRGVGAAVGNIKTLGLIAAGAIASQVTLGVQSLAQLETVKNQTNAVIESTKGAANISADAVRAQAEALENLSTVDDKVIQAGQNMLLTFTNVRNEVGEGNDIFDQATETMLDMSVALGSDATETAIQLGKALNDPIRGITALRRVGVQFTDDQQKQIKAMVEAGDVMGAQRLILAELNTEFGGSAKAFGEGPAASMRRFGDAVEDGQQALATGFLPLIEKVSEKVQTLLANPAVLAQIENFGVGLAGGIDELINVAANLPWDSIGSAFQLLGTGAKAALDFFTGMPPWVQTAVLTGWGLNKLTGGALGNIVGALGSGLVKGVLGMNAGVVNINAATVTGGPGGVPGGGAGGGLGGKILGGAAIIGGAAAVGVAAVEVHNFQEMRTQAISGLEGILDNMPRRTGTEINESISRIEGEISKDRPFLEGILFNTNVKPVLEEELAALQQVKTHSERAAAGSWAVVQPITSARDAIHSLNASEGSRFAQQIGAVRGVGSNVLQLARTPHNVNAQVNAQVNVTNNIGVSVIANQLYRIRTSTNSGGFI